jgi:D-3-phosphoglycerate dehydrogenase
MSKYQIQVYNQISSHGLHRFPSSRYAVGKALEQPDAIVLRSHDLTSVPIPGSVKAIGRAGSGTNNIPVAAMSKRGVPVFNAPGANANAVKELVLAAVLMAARNVVPALQYVNALSPTAPDLDKRVEDGKKQFAGHELPGKTLGIVGRRNRQPCRRHCNQAGMKVTGFDPDITVDAVAPALQRAARARYRRALKTVDFVTLHCRSSMPRAA